MSSRRDIIYSAVCCSSRALVPGHDPFSLHYLFDACWRQTRLLSTLVQPTGSIPMFINASGLGSNWQSWTPFPISSPQRLFSLLSRRNHQFWSVRALSENDRVYPRLCHVQLICDLLESEPRTFEWLVHLLWLLVIWKILSHSRLLVSLVFLFCLEHLGWFLESCLGFHLNRLFS